MNQQIENEQDQLAVIVASSPLEKTKAEKLKEMFVPYLDSMHTLEKKIAAIDKENPTAVDMKIARETRLAIAKNRTAAEKKKDELKQSVIIEGRIIDSFFGVINNTSKSIELSLSNIEKAAEIKEAARRKELAAEHAEQLSVYEIDLTGYDLGAMTDTTFNQLLENTKAGHEKRLEEKRKEEELRIQREANERLHKEREQELKPWLKFIDVMSLLNDYSSYNADQWKEIINEAGKIKSKVQLHEERKNMLTPVWDYIPEDWKGADLSAIDQIAYEECIEIAGEKKQAYLDEQQRIKEENDRLKKEAEEQKELQTRRFKALQPYTEFVTASDTPLYQLTTEAFDALLFDAQAAYNKDLQLKAGRKASAEQLLIALDFELVGNVWCKHSIAIELPVFNADDTLQQWVEVTQTRNDRLMADIGAKEKEEADRKALLAPDKEKLNALANTIDAIVMPEIANTELIAKIKELLTKTSAYTRQQAEKL